MFDIYKLIRLAWPYIGPVLGLLTLAWALDVGIARIKGWAPIILAYVFSVRPLWLILAVLFFYFTYVNIRHRRVPLTVVSTDIKLTLNSPTGDRATLTRTQRIRANREDVTGYHRVLGVEPGEIPKESIRFNIDHCTTEKQSIHFEGNPRRWELIHRFDPIPRKLYCLGLNTVTRTETVVEVNAYTADEESYTMIIPEHYAHKRITLEISFHPGRACEFKNCEAMRSNNNGIVRMPLDDIPSTGVRLRIRNPSSGERFKITWKYPPLATPPTPAPGR